MRIQDVYGFQLNKNYFNIINEGSNYQLDSEEEMWDDIESSEDVCDEFELKHVPMWIAEIMSGFSRSKIPFPSEMQKRDLQDFKDFLNDNGLKFILIAPSHRIIRNDRHPLVGRRPMTTINCIVRRCNLKKNSLF